MASDEVNILANPLNTENIVNEAENVDPTGSTEKEAAHEQQEPIEAANVTLTRCQHIFEQLSGASCGECNAYPKCKVSKYKRRYQLALPLTAERESEWEFELAVRRLQEAEVSTDDQAAAGSAEQSGKNGAKVAQNEPERDAESFRKALDAWRAASLRQKAFANKRSDLAKMKTKFRPGQLSETLREALGLQADELPVHIYRMRVLGYPPAWLQQAVVLENVDQRDCDASRSEPRRKQYNIRKVIDFPGFNVYAADHVRDEHRRFNAPRLHRSALKWNFVAELNGESSRRAREYRSMCERSANAPGDSASESESGSDSEAEDPAADANQDESKAQNEASQLQPEIPAKVTQPRTSLEEGELNDEEMAAPEQGDSSVKNTESLVNGGDLTTETKLEGENVAAAAVESQVKCDSVDLTSQSLSVSMVTDDRLSRVASSLLESSTYDLSRLFKPEDDEEMEDGGNDGNGEPDTREGGASERERKSVLLPDGLPDLSKFAQSIEPYEAWNISDRTTRLERLSELITDRKTRLRSRSKVRKSLDKLQTDSIPCDGAMMGDSKSPSAPLVQRSFSTPQNPPSHNSVNAFPFSQPACPNFLGANYNNDPYAPPGHTGSSGDYGQPHGGYQRPYDREERRHGNHRDRRSPEHYDPHGTFGHESRERQWESGQRDRYEHRSRDHSHRRRSRERSTSPRRNTHH